MDKINLEINKRCEEMTKDVECLAIKFSKLRETANLENLKKAFFEVNCWNNNLVSILNINEKTHINELENFKKICSSVILDRMIYKIKIENNLMELSKIDNETIIKLKLQFIILTNLNFMHYIKERIENARINFMEQ